MPQTKSAKKALKSGERKRALNDRWRRAVREAVNDIRKANAANDKKAAEKAYLVAQSALDKAVKRNIFHKNTVARRKSQLQKLVK